MTPSDLRFRLLLHYDGGDFHGWQVQPGKPTVQGELEQVCARLFDRPARIVGSGRTDRGVHATGQVAVVDAPGRWSAGALLRALNSLLPSGIWVESCDPVAHDFHPRYDATARTYHYHIATDRAAESPFHRRWCWPVSNDLDVTRFREAMERLVGDHSFLRFAKAGQEHRGDRCIVSQVELSPWADLGWRFEITANRYLHHMVRYLVGTLVAIGQGRRPITDMDALLRAEPGLKTSPPAPAEGLFLARVDYRKSSNAT